jgi:hypothetical protein
VEEQTNKMHVPRNKIRSQYLSQNFLSKHKIAGTEPWLQHAEQYKTVVPMYQQLWNITKWSAVW